MKNLNDLKWKILPLIVVSLWGMTFISLEVAGKYFTPVQVMLIRSTLGYVSLLAIHPHFHKSEGIKQELTYLAAGVFGMMLYVMALNAAFVHTEVSNVSVLSSTSPIFVALLTPLFFKGSKISKAALLGFLIATVGTVFIATNGNFSFSLSLVGDGLALFSAVSWAIYSLVLKLSKSEHSQLYVTRRILLYGILAAIPVQVLQGVPINFAAFKDISVVLNLLFLGLVALTACHVAWGLVIRKKGAVWSSKFQYLTPVVTLIFSAILLGENITLFKILGTALILLGVIVADGLLSKKDGSAKKEEI